MGGGPRGIRIPVSALRGPRPGPLDDGATRAPRPPRSIAARDGPGKSTTRPPTTDRRNSGDREGHPRGVRVPIPTGTHSATQRAAETSLRGVGNPLAIECVLELVHDDGGLSDRRLVSRALLGLRRHSPDDSNKLSLKVYNHRATGAGRRGQEHLVPPRTVCDQVSRRNDCWSAPHRQRGQDRDALRRAERPIITTLAQFDVGLGPGQADGRFRTTTSWFGSLVDSVRSARGVVRKNDSDGFLETSPLHARREMGLCRLFDAVLRRHDVGAPPGDGVEEPMAQPSLPGRHAGRPQGHRHRLENRCPVRLRLSVKRGLSRARPSERQAARRPDIP